MQNEIHEIKIAIKILIQTKHKTIMCSSIIMPQNKTDDFQNYVLDKCFGLEVILEVILEKYQIEFSGCIEIEKLSDYTTMI